MVISTFRLTLHILGLANGHSRVVMGEGGGGGVLRTIEYTMGELNLYRVTGVSLLSRLLRFPTMPLWDWRFCYSGSRFFLYCANWELPQSVQVSDVWCARLSNFHL